MTEYIDPLCQTVILAQQNPGHIENELHCRKEVRMRYQLTTSLAVVQSAIKRKTRINECALASTVNTIQLEIR